MYNVEKEYLRYVENVGGRIISSENPMADIKKTRASLGITQEEIGNLVKLRRETISRIENGIINPTFEFVKKFSKTIAAAKVIRDLQALEEVSILSGKSAGSLPLNLLRICFNTSLQDLKLISDVSIRSYYRSRAKIIKRIKSEV
ncbi:MAG: helix-turn-helix transcriptional regulator [Methanobacteriota archaeon]